MTQTATDAARAIRAREVSPVELVERALDRAERWQPATNAFSQIHAQEALDEARRRADQVAAGDVLGPLHGVPVVVKDLFDVEGWETSGCCQGYRGQRARADSEVVGRLREAGAVIVAKTNQHELAAGATNAISSHGPTRNPWDPTRITGGSSGGSAAAVAARVVPLGLGTDTGGSIRIPSSFCGTMGLKPTLGRISMAGAMALAPSLDTAGPLAATAADLALAFEVLAGESGLAEAAARPADGLRVGVAGGFFSARVHPEILKAVDAVREAFENADVKTVDASVGELSGAPEVWDRVAWPEFAAVHGHLLRRPETLYPKTRTILEYGSQRTALDYLKAKEAAVRIRAMFISTLDEADVLLAPCTAFAAPQSGTTEVPVGEGVMDVDRGGASWLTRPVNLAGLPALALPAAFSAGGLPLGVQLIGRPGEEITLLRAATALQEWAGEQARVPAL